MITHPLTMNFFSYLLLLVKNKSRSKFRSRKKVTLIFALFSVYIFFNEKAFVCMPTECLCILRVS